jgi:hypothetical protein
MALKLMPQSQVDQIIKTVNNLENLNDVSVLTKLLAAQKTSQGE